MAWARHPSSAIAVLGAAALAALATAALTLSGTTLIAHAGATPTAVVLVVLACTMLITAAALDLSVTRLRLLSMLSASAVPALLAPVWVGWQNGPAIVRGTAAVIAAMLPVIVFAMATFEPTGRPRSARWPVAAAALVLVLALGVVAFRDPFRDLQCWSDCTASTALLPWPAGSTAAGTALIAVEIAIAVASTLSAIRGLRGRGGAARAWAVAVRVPATLSVSIIAMHGAWFATVGGERTSDTASRAFAIATVIAMTVLGAGCAWVAAAQLYRRARADDLIQRLAGGDQPGRLRDVFAALLGDPDVTVAYWLAEPGCFVDDEGVVIERPRLSGAVEVRRDGDLLAVVTTSTELTGGGEILPRLGSAAAKGIDNERLQAELGFRLSEVVLSRRRIVESALEARRTLERDLHDGVQAGVVALLYALASARSTGDPRIPELMAEASGIAERLRAIAHGTHPSLVDELGLASALDSIGDSSPVRIHASSVIDEAPRNVAAIAYDVARQGADSWSGPQPLLIEVDGELAVTLTFVGGAVSFDRQLEDRVAALGGTITHARIGSEVVIPCA